LEYKNIHGTSSELALTLNIGRVFHSIDNPDFGNACQGKFENESKDSSDFTSTLQAGAGALP
jgi:hypothetical protein